MARRDFIGLRSEDNYLGTGPDDYFTQPNAPPAAEDTIMTIEEIDRAIRDGLDREAELHTRQLAAPDRAEQRRLYDQRWAALEQTFILIARRMRLMAAREDAL